MLSASGLAIATLTLTIGPLRSSEPAFRGKKLSSWLVHLDSLDREQYRQGAEAILALGTNCLPLLAERLRAKDSPIRRTIIDFLDAYPVATLVRSEAHHESALEACRILGTAASPLIPEITPFLAGNRRTKAVKVLVAIGERSVPALVRELASTDAEVRAGAAVTLGSIARQPAAVISGLTECLDDPHAEVRMSAAWALGRFGADAQTAVQQLSALTNDSAHNVRKQASVALARIRSSPPVD